MVVTQSATHKHLGIILYQLDQQYNWIIKKVTKNINSNFTAYNI